MYTLSIVLSFTGMAWMTVASQIAAHLRSEILRGATPPGTRLLQDAEAARLGVSRTPIREAFQQLEAEGLLKIIPNRGAVVVSLSAEDISEIYLIRSHLESVAAAEAARRVTQRDLDDVETILQEIEALTADGAWIDLLEANKRFHFRIYQASQLPRLVSMISSLWGPIEAVRAAYVSVPDRATRATGEHDLLYKALKRQDPAAASDITRQHIHGTAKNLIRRLQTPHLNPSKQERAI
jgi:DNA-binding GntR family transcriptional regulator